MLLLFITLIFINNNCNFNYNFITHWCNCSLLVVDRVGDFILFVGKLLVAFACTLLGAVVLQQKVRIPGVEVVDVGRFWAVPLLLIALLSYMIAAAFMTLYEMAIDTIFLSFCKNIASPLYPLTLIIV